LVFPSSNIGHCRFSRWSCLNSHTLLYRDISSLSFYITSLRKSV
jgi:hypothetical protein